MSYPWGTERRFNAYSDFFRSAFGSRVQKISIDAGFTCPNRDGTCGVGGCTFCDNSAFTPSYNRSSRPVSDQIEAGMEFHRKRYRKASRYLAYFQAYTNTYGDLDRLDALYKEALGHPGVIGIVVGTRPDCVDEPVLEYFSELSRHAYVAVEYGIESLLDRTLRRVNRGHSVSRSKWAVEQTAAKGIRTGGHLIIGLPGEKREDFLQTASTVSHWPLNTVKFHQLQVIRGTVMAQEYLSHPEAFVDPALDDYLDLMTEILERLNPSFVVERIAGEVAPGKQLNEGWGLRYDAVLRAFEKLLEKKDTWQGKYYRQSK